MSTVGDGAVRDRCLAVALFVLALAPYVYFYGGWGANQEVNYALTRAIVEGHTLSVDDYTVHEGDIAAGKGGRIFSNKPPGLSLLAVPPYSLQYAAQRRQLVTFRDYWQTNKQLVTIVVCGISGALLAPILYLYARRRLNIPPMDAAIVCIAIAFGTIVFPYSTMFFAHVPAALFLLLAFVLLRDRPFWAGVGAGISGMCFLLSAVAALVLAIILGRESRPKLLRFVAGGAPFAIALGIYQWMCFGSPFTTSLEKSAGYTEQGRLFGVFGLPRLAPLAAITVSEYRGLFVCSPILLFAIAGAVVMIRRREHISDLVAVAAITAVFLFANASFNGWHGGAAFGPRYLLPVIPLLAIPMFYAAARFRAVWLILGVLSIAINVLATSVDAMPIDGVTRPLTGYLLPSFLGRPISNEARAIEYPDCRTSRCTSNEVALVQDSRNFGEPLFGKGKRVTVLPAIVWIAIGSTLVLRSARSGSRRTPA